MVHAPGRAVSEVCFAAFLTNLQSSTTRLHANAISEQWALMILIYKAPHIVLRTATGTHFSLQGVGDEPHLATDLLS
jgi:hypothetical protein